MNKFLIILDFILLINGCASSSKNVGTSYISPTKYKDYTCDELAEEGQYISQRINELSKSLDNESMKDPAQATSAFVLAPFTFGLSLDILGALEGGGGPEAIEYSKLKGEYQAVYETSKRKKCRIDRYR